MSNPTPVPPSIFNDVIGPVMRGPSSSHCAAALRIGRMARDLMDGRIDSVRVQFDSSGSLATTHTSQGSDMGLLGGLLGWEATDERLTRSAEAVREAGIQVEMEIVDLGASHPNTYRLILKNDVEEHTLTALSTGGGMIEVVEVDGVKVSMGGDTYETLVFVDCPPAEVPAENLGAEEILVLDALVEIKARRFPERELLEKHFSQAGIRSIKRIAPVLPVLSRREMRVPFLNSEEMFGYDDGKGRALWELAVDYESARGSLAPAQVLEKMGEIVAIMQASIRAGLAGTEYADRILGYQSGGFQSKMDSGGLLDGGMLNRMILYTTAMMEAKSSMGVIVAAPTAGSCGGLPGACLGAADTLGLSPDETAKAMLAAGLIGVFVAAHATFAAEVGGCQAECGAGSGMAAAALVTLAGGSTRQAVDAASMAFQNILGMVCDPVANRVEVPCLGKNVMAAANALSCANMALAGYDKVVPLDEVIAAMDKVGKSLPHELRCTALGGLSVTKTSLEITKRLGGNE